MPELLWETISLGLESYRDALAREKNTLVPLAEKFAKEAKDQEVSTAAANLLKILRKGDAMPQFSNMELKILRTILAEANSAAMKPSNSPKPKEMKSGIHVLQNTAEWADEIADDAELMKI